MKRQSDIRKILMKHGLLEHGRNIDDLDVLEHPHHYFDKSEPINVDQLEILISMQK